MLSRLASKKLLTPPSSLRQTALRSLSSEGGGAAAATTMVKLNFCLPYETIYKEQNVFSVIIPGVEGEYGVTGGHVPYVAQLKPGVLQILHKELGDEPEKYFVAGGYALTHANSQTDVVCPEAVKIDDIDQSAVQSNFESAKNAFNSATAGTKESAEAQIEMEVNRAMGLALGINLS